MNIKLNGIYRHVIACGNNNCTEHNFKVIAIHVSGVDILCCNCKQITALPNTTLRHYCKPVHDNSQKTLKGWTEISCDPTLLTCECGSDSCNLPHSDWCPKYQ